MTFESLIGVLNLFCELKMNEEFKAEISVEIMNPESKKNIGSVDEVFFGVSSHWINVMAPISRRHLEFNFSWNWIQLFLNLKLLSSLTTLSEGSKERMLQDRERALLMLLPTTRATQWLSRLHHCKSKRRHSKRNKAWLGQWNCFISSYPSN